MYVNSSSQSYYLNKAMLDVNLKTFFVLSYKAMSELLIDWEHGYDME